MLKVQTELPKYALQFKYPAQGTAALQNARMDDLIAAATNAILISSVDPKTSIEAFNRIAMQVPLFATDSDAPDSNRIAYLGSSKTLVGVQAGEIAVKAMPKGMTDDISAMPVSPRLISTPLGKRACSFNFTGCVATGLAKSVSICSGTNVAPASRVLAAIGLNC